MANTGLRYWVMAARLAPTIGTARFHAKYAKVDGAFVGGHYYRKDLPRVVEEEPAPVAAVSGGGQ